MFDVQSEASVRDQIHTFEVPIKFTRTQLEKMLRAVDADVDDTELSTSTPTVLNALTALAVKKAADLIEITSHEAQI